MIFGIHRLRLAHGFFVYRQRSIGGQEPGSDTLLKVKPIDLLEQTDRWLALFYAEGDHGVAFLLCGLELLGNLVLE